MGEERFVMPNLGPRDSVEEIRRKEAEDRAKYESKVESEKRCLAKEKKRKKIKEGSSVSIVIENFSYKFPYLIQIILHINKFIFLL